MWQCKIPILLKLTHSVKIHTHEYIRAKPIAKDNMTKKKYVSTSVMNAIKTEPNTKTRHIEFNRNHMYSAIVFFSLLISLFSGVMRMYKIHTYYIYCEARADLPVTQSLLSMSNNKNSSSNNNNNNHTNSSQTEKRKKGVYVLCGANIYTHAYRILTLTFIQIIAS